MEDVPHILTPMHEQLVKDPTADIMVQSFLEVLVENVVVLIYHCKHLNKSLSTF
jgi:hypothetical protein